MPSRVKRIRKRLMVQFSTPDYCLCSEDHFVYRYTYALKRLEFLFTLPCSSYSLQGKLKDSILRHSLVRTFRKNIGIFDVVELPSGTILALYDKIYRYPTSQTAHVAEARITFEQFRFYAPLHYGVAVNPENACVYFGEYQISRPYAVKIMRVYNDGKEAEICYTFPKGQIRHIHSLTWDPFRKRMWIATGDSNEEAGLYYTDDDFQTVFSFNGGSQTWRMVSLLPTEHDLYWGSDAGKDATEQDINYIYHWDFRTEQLERLQYIGNPAYYSTFLDNGGMIIGTVYEPGIKHKTGYEAALWYSRYGKQWEKLYAIPYLNVHTSNRTQYATFNVPKGIVPYDNIMLTPLNTRDYDFELLSLKAPCFSD